MEVLKKSSGAINKAAAVLKNGGVVICPTDTVYGFLADATNKKAVEKIYKIKRRPKLKPLPVFVSNVTMAKELAEINEQQTKTARKFWPGKFTFILKVQKNIDLGGLSSLVEGRDGTIALRIPKYKFLNSLLKKINRPLAQTSVNISNNPSLTNIEDIINQFGKNKLVDLIIDGGNLKKSQPSKIIDLTSKHLTRLR